MNWRDKKFKYIRRNPLGPLFSSLLVRTPRIRILYIETFLIFPFFLSTFFLLSRVMITCSGGVSIWFNSTEVRYQAPWLMFWASLWGWKMTILSSRQFPFEMTFFMFVSKYRLANNVVFVNYRYLHSRKKTLFLLPIRLFWKTCFAEVVRKYVFEVVENQGFFKPSETL